MTVLLVQGFVIGVLLGLPLLVQPLRLGLAIMGIAICLSVLIGGVSS